MENLGPSLLEMPFLTPAMKVVSNIINKKDAKAISYADLTNNDNNINVDEDGFIRHKLLLNLS